MPPAVTLLNYVSSGILWRIFFPNWNFRGVFSVHISFTGRNSEAAMGGGARSAPFGVVINPKRRVRAAHGRAREAKTH